MYSVRNFTYYELINQLDGNRITGRKQAFCLMDIRKMDQTLSGGARYTCRSQGISVGWADIYSYNLDGQWIDITGVPAGTYTLKVTINPDGIVFETDYTDNTSTQTVNILTGSNCPP
jgi:hypothetical protein